MRDYPYIFYLDSSVRLLKKNILNQMKTQIEETGGILQFKTPGHSIFSATHPNIYTYFKCSFKQTKTGKFNLMDTL